MRYKTRHLSYNNLGYVYHIQGDYHKAIAAYKKATLIFNRFSQAYHNMGISYEKLNQWTDAVQAYQFSIQYAPDVPNSYFAMSKIYLFQLSRPTDAAKALDKVIETDSSGAFEKEAKKLLRLIRNK